MTRELGQCGLCQTPSVELCDSHIIPRAIAKWAKAKAREGDRKAFWDINNERLIQDFPRLPMLCVQCDNERFSSLENRFISEILKPYHDELQSEFMYEEWLRYYAVSQGWRLLHHLRELVKTGNAEQLGEKLLCYLKASRTDEVFEVWRQYLMGKRSDPGTHQYLYFFSHLYRNSNVMWGGRLALEVEYAQLVDAGPIFSDQHFALTSQTYGILLVCPVNPAAWPELESARIEPRGRASVESHGRPPELLSNWMHHRMSELKEYVERTQPESIRRRH